MKYKIVTDGKGVNFSLVNTGGKREFKRMRKKNKLGNNTLKGILVLQRRKQWPTGTPRRLLIEDLPSELSDPPAPHTLFSVSLENLPLASPFILLWQFAASRGPSVSYSSATWRRGCVCPHVRLFPLLKTGLHLWGLNSIHPKPDPASNKPPNLVLGPVIPSRVLGVRTILLEESFKVRCLKDNGVLQIVGGERGPAVNCTGKNG